MIFFGLLASQRHPLADVFRERAICFAWFSLAFAVILLLVGGGVGFLRFGSLRPAAFIASPLMFHPIWSIGGSYFGGYTSSLSQMFFSALAFTVVMILAKRLPPRTNPAAHTLSLRFFFGLTAASALAVVCSSYSLGLARFVIFLVLMCYGVNVFVQAVDFYDWVYATHWPPERWQGRW